MKQYLDLMKKVLDTGDEKVDRTGTGTKSIFGHQMRFNLNDGFPLLTTKTVHLKSIIHELIWFLSGSTNIKYLNDNGVKIWDEWADSCGEIGPAYGHQWVNYQSSWGRINQIQEVIDQIKTNPASRRLIVNAWNVGEVNDMALPPCHMMFQFYVSKGRISCHLYQRSGDIFLGIPFNIASYALLLMMVAKVTKLKPFELVHTIGDAHLYNNHIEQAKLQLTREPKKLPKMEVNPYKDSIFNFVYEDFKLYDYDAYPSIKAPVAV